MRDGLLRASDREDLTTFREDLARRYLRGSGIEIGALQRPIRLPRGTRVRYVDLMSRDELLATHTSAVYGDPNWVVETDVIDDCERLDSFADGSLDFAIANHILEHTEDPIAALENLVRVLRPGGILLLPSQTRVGLSIGCAHAPRLSTFGVTIERGRTSRGASTTANGRALSACLRTA
jgi:SAM-dependent methyltransferase